MRGADDGLCHVGLLLVNVWQNSNSALPLIYKITGVWGNHEGSMLLWILVLTLCGAVVAAFGHNLPDKLKALVLAVQGWIGAAFLFFILFTSNPFTRLASPPVDGVDLNPTLQDIGLAIHPPLLYIGYVGCSIAFSFAIAALIEGKIDAAWARWTRPWTLAAWLFLTLGVAMGSYWAYYTLGWGGFWFWDPVENAALMPWLATTALLHSAIVMEKRDALKIWTVLLAILAFSLSLVGTFLVRSGVLTSVHAFATDPTRGSSSWSYSSCSSAERCRCSPSVRVRWRRVACSPRSAARARSSSTILLLTAAAATVFVGTLYPLALEAVGGTRISVGEPFFDLTFVPLVIPLLMLVPYGPHLAWKRGDLKAAAAASLAVAALAIVAAVRFSPGRARPWLAPFRRVAGGLAGCRCRYRVGFPHQAVRTASLGRTGAGLPACRARPMARSFAHAGLGLVVIGIVATTAWRSDFWCWSRRGWPTSRAPISVSKASRRVGGRTIRSARDCSRWRAGLRRSRSPLRSASSPLADNHGGRHRCELAGRSLSVLGDQLKDGAYSVRVYFNPLVRFYLARRPHHVLWRCPVSLSDRRLRVGAPKRARALGQDLAAAK